MVKNNASLKTDSNTLVIRICDECGKEESARVGVIVRGRRRRGENVDLCCRCSNSPKYKKSSFLHTMEKAVNWTGGRHDNGHGYMVIYAGKGKRVFEHVMIYEKYIGRKLAKGEKIHHIDMDKKNNEISNFYLCKNRSTHMKCHSSAENCGYKFLGKHIWFDWESKKYTLEYKNNYPNFMINIEDILTQYKTKIIVRETNNKKYLVFFQCKPRGYKNLHTVIGERMMGRKLYRDEQVHHINGDSLDNSFSNLCVMTLSEHSICHRHLQLVVAELYKKGIIGFEDGNYFIKEKL